MTSPESREPTDREWTVERWAMLDEDTPGELVDGRLVEEEVTTILHEAAVARLLAWLVFWGDPRKARVYASELKLRVGERRGRKPDLSVYFAEAPHPGGLEHVACVPPSIVVEVVSKRPRDVRRDRIEKLGDYARFGVPWFWLLDPFRRTFEVLELAPDGRYVVALAAEAGAHAAPGCEGLVIDLDDLWRRLDELPGRT